MSAKIIAFMNQKGGTGKTTSALNVGACLSHKGYKVLLIDTDPQGHLTIHSGIIPAENALTLYEVMTGKADINSAIINVNSFDLLPVDVRLSGIDLELVNKLKREEILKQKISQIKKEYDFIIIDSPPALSLLTVNIMTATDFIIMPVQAQFFAYHGMKKLLETIDDIKDSGLNPALQIAGVVVTMADQRRNLDTTIINSLNELLPEKIYKTVINNNIALAEAGAYGKDIYNYNGASKGAEQYEQLTNEIIKGLEK